MKENERSDPWVSVSRGVIFWVVLPIVLFLLGYRFIGPRIGEVPALRASAERVQDMVTESAKEEATKPNDKIDESKLPEVEVTVEKSSSKRKSEQEDEPKRRSRRSTPRKEPERPVDEGSVDGAIPDENQPSEDPGPESTDGGNL